MATLSNSDERTVQHCQNRAEAQDRCVTSYGHQWCYDDESPDYGFCEACGVSA